MARPIKNWTILSKKVQVVKKMNKDTNLIWIDLEMTGLIPEKDVIIEIATVVTDKDLNVLAHCFGEWQVTAPRLKH